METAGDFFTLFRELIGIEINSGSWNDECMNIIFLLENTVDEALSCLNMFYNHCSFCSVCFSTGRRSKLLECIEWIVRVYSVSFSRYCPVHKEEISITEDFVLEFRDRESDTLLVSRNVLKLKSCRRAVSTGISVDDCL